MQCTHLCKSPFTHIPQPTPSPLKTPKIKGLPADPSSHPPYHPPLQSHQPKPNQNNEYKQTIGHPNPPKQHDENTKKTNTKHRWTPTSATCSRRCRTGFSPGAVRVCLPCPARGVGRSILCVYVCVCMYVVLCGRDCVCMCVGRPIPHPSDPSPAPPQLNNRGHLHLDHQGALPGLQGRLHRRLRHLYDPLPPVRIL